MSKSRNFGMHMLVMLVIPSMVYFIYFIKQIQGVKSPDDFCEFRQEGMAHITVLANSSDFK